MGQHMHCGRGAQTRTTHVLCHRGLPDTTTCSGCLRGRLSLHQASPGSHPTTPPSHTMWHVLLHQSCIHGDALVLFRTYRICVNSPHSRSIKSRSTFQERFLRRRLASCVANSCSTFTVDESPGLLSVIEASCLYASTVRTIDAWPCLPKAQTSFGRGSTVDSYTHILPALEYQERI
ncbi:hypothetical protein BKA93DRAFT_104208 [Sparassis latifolia]